MNDLISRQAAIDALDCINGVEEVLRSLPPAQPTIEPRAKGEWITNGYGAVICSKCNWPAPMIMTGCLVNRHLEYDKSDFCWHCGADMRGEQDG